MSSSRGQERSVSTPLSTFGINSLFRHVASWRPPPLAFLACGQQFLQLRLIRTNWARKLKMNSWRHFTKWTLFEKKVMNRFRKSVRPLQLEFGSFYVIRPKKIMGFWNTLVWLVVRALLSFPETSAWSFKYQCV